jgi:hemerythrin-like metal-binding protein
MQEKAVRDLYWGKDLSVEVDEIDEDHRKLISIFNILNHAVTDGESPQYLSAVLEELVNCTIWHFSHEERLMLKHGYEGMEEHKAIHRELIKSVKKLEQRILQADETMTDEDVEFLEVWLTEHILTEDMRLGSYLSQII